MDKAHDVRNLTFSGALLRFEVNGARYEVDLAGVSKRIAEATQDQIENVEVSPTGYGLHWPDLDEDLSIDGLIGVEHTPPMKAKP